MTNDAVIKKPRVVEFIKDDYKILVDSRCPECGREMATGAVYGELEWPALHFFLWRCVTHHGEMNPFYRIERVNDE